MTELICVGMIAGAFGVRGEVRVKSFCANPAIWKLMHLSSPKRVIGALKYH